MTTMIGLVGDQQLPNFLPIRHIRPEHVVLLYTSKTLPKYKNLKVVLEPGVKVYGIEIHPYDISAIADKLNDELKKSEVRVSDPLIFNLTGGTKMMSLAAYQVALQYNAPIVYLQSEGIQSVIDHYHWKDTQLYHQSREVIPEYLSLHEMLDLHLGRRKNVAENSGWNEVWPTNKSEDGHIFELAIEQALREAGYEVRCGIKNSRGDLDIDLVIRYQNHVGIIQAKTGKKAQRFEGIHQLSSGMRYLGGTYIKQFLAINREPSDNQQEVCKVLSINIVPLLHRQDGMISLPAEDIDTLLTNIDRVMKVGATKS